MRAVEEEHEPAAVPENLKPARIPDPLASYDASGWLEYHPRNELGRRFSVQKGEQILFWVNCSSGRYDLSLFVGAEIGIRGPDHRPAAESLRMLDAQRIQVLSAPR